MTILQKTFRVLASYGLACVLLTMLLFLVFFGTIEQVEHGLYEVQKRYFESFFLYYPIGGVNVPIMFGAYPIIGLLFINLLCGAIIRAPKDIKRPGMLIAHGGILYLILAAFVTAEFSTSGHLSLFEGESGNFYDDYYYWEVAITELGKESGAKTYRINHDQFAFLKPDESRTFNADALPFALEISSFAPNTAPRQAAPALGEKGIDGLILEPLPLEKEAERNLAGATLTLLPKTGGGAQQGYGWGLAAAPWVVNVDGQEFAISLRHKKYHLPFTITLDKFIRELHPRTQMASNFESEVTQTEGGVARKVDIRMNEPLRHKGYTLFQASWGPEGARPGEPLMSTFAVVNNPADQWPKYACYVIAIGMIIHFSQRLAGYIRQQNRRRAS